jgi:hypothetical protein
MTPSSISKEQAMQVLKAALYVSISAGLDYVISETQGTQFGTLTPLINTVLVVIKKIFTPAN